MNSVIEKLAEVEETAEAIVEHARQQKSEIEKSNVIQTLGKTEEKNTKDLEDKKEKNTTKENENGFRQYEI